jgi:hypothetical protein
MKFALPFLLILASCGGVPPREPEDLALLLDLMGRADALHREEAVHRLSIAGESVPDVLEGRDRALEFAQADTASIRDRVTTALKEPSPERQVWLAWHALRLGCLAREWRAVYDALTRQGCRLIEIYEPDDRTKFVRLMIQTGAYVNDARDRHDLFCWVQSVRRDGGAPWHVREVVVGLHVRHNAAFKAISATPRYPRASVLQQFLDLPDLQKLAAIFPSLEEIEFTYGRIRDRNADGAPAGFHVNAGFVMDGNAGGRSVYYTAEAGLDPREIDRGRLDWAGFTPSAAVGPLTPRGSGIWGAGGLRPVDEY